MQWNNARRPEDRLSKPPHSKQQEEHSDEELEERKRNAVEKRAKHEDQYAQNTDCRGGPDNSRSPSAQRSDRQDDRERFDDLHERSEERGADGWRGYAPIGWIHHYSSEFRTL